MEVVRVMEVVKVTAVVRVLVLLLAGCSSTPEPSESSAKSPFWFTDVTAQSGLDWSMTYGTDSTTYILETTGSGGSWIDYDRDGFLDIYLVNGSHFDPDILATIQPRSVLYHNNGDGTFSDVTDQAGVAHAGWGAMALADDFDGDGWTDLYVTAWGPNSLYHNNGDGTFTEIGAAAGVDDPAYSTAASSFDYNGDGHTDIFVTNYVPFDPATAELPGTSFRTIVRGIRSSMVPEGYTGAPDRLYKNMGDGTFVDVANEEGFNQKPGRGLGSITLDFDGDGWTDLYVANDAMANHLYRRTPEGVKAFEEVGTKLGAAYAEGGLGAGSMGLAAGDLDGDGRPEIVVTNYEDQMVSLYHFVHGRLFRDVTSSWGIGGPTLISLQWGINLADFDLDGDLDMYIAAGHVLSRLEVRYPHSTFVQLNQIYQNNGRGRFTDVSRGSGPGVTDLKYCSRGSASADYDNDGDLDILVINKSGSVNLLRNDTQTDNHWIGFDLRLSARGRTAVGAVVTVVAGGRRQVREVRLGSSYLATEDPRLLFGLGKSTSVDSVTVLWPGRALMQWKPMGVDDYFELIP